MVNIPSNNALRMPILGFGTWQIPKEKAESIVDMAIKIGYNHIDCAAVYANEEAVGKSLSKVDRTKLFITSKLWSNCHEASQVRPALEKTLKDLGLEYLDMYLIHNPIRIDKNGEYQWYDRHKMAETWREMEKLKEAGLTKHIGVSNFTIKKLNHILEIGGKPENNQVEIHPYLPQKDLHKFCQDNNIVITAYSPLGSPGTAQSWPQAITPNSPVLLNDATINLIAKKHNTTPAQVLIKWSMESGFVVIPKASSEGHMKENFESLNLKLDSDDMKLINDISIRARYLSFDLLLPKGKTVADFWDENE